MARVISVEEDKGKKVLKQESVFMKARRKPDHELEGYKGIKGKDIVLEVLAVIVDKEDDDKAIGFVQRAVEGQDATKGDLDACKKVLEKLHEEGWLHMDPNRGNYKKVDGKWLIYDFEDSLKTDGEDAYEDLEPDDDDRRKELDLIRQKTLFENVSRRRKN